MDVICASKSTFSRQDDKIRRAMARQFYLKVVQDVQKHTSAKYPTEPKPHYMKNFSTWPLLPEPKFRNNQHGKLKEFMGLA